MLDKVKIDLDQYGAKKAAMHHNVKPMQAETAGSGFSRPNWIFEIKWDGYRAIAEIEQPSEKIRLYSRNLISFNQAYPVIVSELKKINVDAVLDGEIVALDEAGKPRFEFLQDYRKKTWQNLVYYCFDILYLNGYSLLNMPLYIRKNILKNILPLSNVIKYSDHVEAHGLEFFEVAKREGLEGIIAKEKDSFYFPGERTKNWLKIKNILEEEAIICGFTPPGPGRAYFGSLVLGSYHDGKLIFRGKVGSGFDDLALKSLFLKFRPLLQKESPFKRLLNIKATWLEPKLVCQIKYSEITKEGFFRQPVFLGLRIDKSAEEVVY